MTGAPGLREAVFAALEAAGFPLVGAASLEAVEGDAERYARFLRARLEGPLAYLRRTAAARLDPRRLFPWVRGAFVAAMPYNASRAPSREAVGRAWVSRYAWGRDYHKTVRRRLRAYPGNKAWSRRRPAAMDGKEASEG